MKRTLKQIVENHIALKSFFILYKHYNNNKITLSELLVKKPYKLQKYLGFPCKTTLPLNKLLIGQQAGYPLKKWIELTNEYSRISTLLKKSPYVSYLRSDLNDESDDEDFKNTDYFIMGKTCLIYKGHFMGKTTESGIIDWMKEYKKMFFSMKTGKQYHSNEMQRLGHSKPGSWIWVKKIKQSNYYEIVDGHHRCAIHYVKGDSHINVKIADESYSYLQETILKSQQIYDFEYYQPLNKPEIESWKLIRNCDDRLTMMFKFLNESGIDGKSYIDLPCSYGYFLSSFKDKGFKVKGVDIDKSSVKIGKIINGLAADEIIQCDIMDFLKKSDNQFHIVSCLSILHHFVMGYIDHSHITLVHLLDKITKKVLFLDTGQAHEKQYAGKLEDWTDEYIIDLIKDNTGFKDVIRLGSDSDNMGNQKQNNSRTLFACIK